MKCCVHCFINPFIQAAVKSEDEINVCSYCDMDGGTESYVADVDVIGELIREKLGLAYKNASTDDVPYHVLNGIATTIEDVLRYDEDIFSIDLDDNGDVPKLIEDLFESSGPSYREIAQGDFDEWEGGVAEIVKIDEFYIGRENNHFRYQWDDFAYLVKHVNRFFDIDDSREEMLAMFNDLLKKMEYVLPQGTLIWRGRTISADSSPDLSKMQYECGPPPRNLSVALRMNPAGISYFYGSIDKNTCEIEIRPKPNEQIIYGHFATTKDLRIMDLSVAPVIFAKSIFDPDYDHSMNWATSFLEGFISEISKPIEENVASIEYVPTQILSEYIRKLGYDGLCFRSSITDELNYTLYCGRKEQNLESTDLHWDGSPRFNQIPEFTEWLKLVKYKV